MKGIVNPVSLWMMACLISCASVGNDATAAKARGRFTKPVLFINDVKVSSLSFDEVGLNIELVMKNHGRESLHIKVLDMAVELEETDFIIQSCDQEFVLGSGETKSLFVTLSIKYADIIDKMPIPDNQSELSFRLESSYQWNTKVPGSPQENAVRKSTYKGSLPLLWKPRFNFQSLDIIGLGLTGADIIVHMHLHNPNPFHISLEFLKGDLDVNELEWTQIITETALGLPPGRTVGLGFQFPLEFLSMGPAVRDLLSRKKDLPCLFKGKMGLKAVLGDFDLQDMDMDLLFTGDMAVIHSDTKSSEHSSQKIEDSIEKNLFNLYGR